MNKGRGIGWAIAGSWLAMTCTAIATPIAPDQAARDKPRTEAIVSDDPVDKRIEVMREVAREVQRTGSGMAPSLGIDDGFLNQGNSSLLHSELREQQAAGMDHWARQKGRSLDGGPDIFKETIDSALKATRDAFFEGGDTANLSLAGIELSVTLRGDRRGLSLNGYDLLASNQQTVIQASDVLQPGMMKTITGAPQETPIVLIRGDEGDGRITLADIRKFFLHPFTIAGMIGLLGVWVVFAMAVSRARRE